jgi:predicted RNase H-like HicB family nuclease
VPAVANEKEFIPVKQRKIAHQQSFVLRCMVYPNKPEGYTAECIDLDIMVRASTPEEALRQIRPAIKGYLAVVFDGETEGLLPRPSPLSHRFRYHVLALRAALTLGVRSSFLISDLSASDLCSG